jgi:hypothetical protein
MPLLGAEGSDFWVLGVDLLASPIVLTGNPRELLNHRGYANPEKRAESNRHQGFEEVYGVIVKIDNQFVSFQKFHFSTF